MLTLLILYIIQIKHLFNICLLKYCVVKITSLKLTSSGKVWVGMLCKARRRPHFSSHYQKNVVTSGPDRFWVHFKWMDFTIPRLFFFLLLKNLPFVFLFFQFNFHFQSLSTTYSTWGNLIIFQFSVSLLSPASLSPRHIQIHMQAAQLASN